MMSDRRWSQVLILLWGAFFISWAIPASFWLDVGQIKVYDSKAGEPIRMEVSREIHRPFSGEWSVLVRKKRGEHWIVVCPGYGMVNYRPDAELPDPLTLEWWTDGACPALAAGTYLLTTSWVLYPAYLPRKMVQITSNEFTVR